MTKKKVLIIKTGRSETLDPDNSDAVSLGDILRTTVILNLFPPETYDVTWVVDKKGAPLLQNNPFIARLLVVNTFTPFYLLNESYDVLVNLEKDVGLLAMAESIHTWERYGFRLRNSDINADKHSEAALIFTKDSEAKRTKQKSWEEVLYEMLGYVYTNEPYVLGYLPKTYEHKGRIGLNHLVGSKFPTKRWDNSSWKYLDYDLEHRGFDVSWQEGTNEIEAYIDWIFSCEVVVTSDSLGLHIAKSLGKKIVALFGPTLADEIHDNEKLVKLVAESGNVNSIDFGLVADAVEGLIKQG